MKSAHSIFLTAVTLLFFSTFFLGCSGNAPDDAAVNVSDSAGVSGDSLDGFIVSASVNYKNLQIFTISGETEAENVDYVPLKRAMENDWIEIIETSEVNELQITNTSDKTIFIHAGDIIKGGKQDRVLAYDMIIAPGTKKEKISSFCVESGRWEKRGEEDAFAFESTTKMITSRDMKIATKQNNEQGAVWSEVAEQQNKLNSNVSFYYNEEVDVKSQASASSLELTLDNEKLTKLKENYKAKFQNLMTENTIGFGYAINGEIYNIDLYNNRKLFVELYDKLLTAAIVEAIADLDSKQTEYKYASLEEFKAALTMNTEADVSAKNLNRSTRWISKEDEEKISFTSVDRKNDKKWVHRNIIVKAKGQQTQGQDAQNVQREQMNLNAD